MIKNKSRKASFVNSKALVVGVDIAKYTHYGRFIFPDGAQTKPFSFVNTRSGFDALVTSIKDSMKAENLDHAVVGIESTGHYWKALAYYLDNFPFIELVQVNPAHVKKAKEIYDSSPGKTDKKDAGIIAMLIQMGKSQNLNLPKKDFLSLRIYARQREQKIVELGIQRNILHSYVDIIFPEYNKIFKKLESKSSLCILEKYSTPDRIIQVGVKRLTSTLRKVSRGKLCECKAVALLNAAKASIGLRDGVEAAVYSIHLAVKNIKRIQLEIRDIEKRQKDLLSNIPYSEQLLSIQGIGPVSLSVILGEVGDIRRYKTAKEPLKLAGLNLYEISSGVHKGRRRISKKGRPLLRKALFFATLRMVKSNGVFRLDYLRLTEGNNMQKTKALVAISRKLMRVLFAIVRDGVNFQRYESELDYAA